MGLFMVFLCGKTDNNQINKVVAYQSVKSAMKKEHHITGGATLDIRWSGQTCLMW